MPEQSRKLLLKRWHTLSGIGPLALFIFLHLGLQATSLAGAGRYQAISKLTGSLLWGVLTGLLVLVPMSFHCAYGLWLTFERSTAPEDGRVTASVFLRVSGLVVLVFLVSHWLHFRAPLLTGEMKPEEIYSELCASLSSTTEQGWPVVAFGYLLGLAATMMHLSFGAATFLRTFEIPDDPDRVRLLIIGERTVHTLCSLGFALGAAVLVELATGSWFFGIW